MSVIERRREAATFIALGYREKWVRNLFLLESAIISIIASTLGTILSYIIVESIGQTGIDMMALGGNAVKGYNFSNYIYLYLPGKEYFTSVLFAVVYRCYCMLFPH